MTQNTKHIQVFSLKTADIKKPEVKMLQKLFASVVNHQNNTFFRHYSENFILLVKQV